GSNDKRALVVGIVIVLALAAALLGTVAAHRPWVGYATVGALAAVGVAAAVTRPQAGSAWAIPSVVAGLAGGAAFAYLSRASVGITRRDQRTRGVAARLDRRRFVRAALVVGASAAVGGVLTRLVTERKMTSTSR